MPDQPPARAAGGGGRSSRSRSKAQGSSEAPLMSLLDLAGRRWLLRIMWELREEQLRFGELRMRCDRMSQSVLTTRLAEMTSAMLVSLDQDAGYRLTPLASELVAITSELDQWAHRWAHECADRLAEPR